MGWSLIRQNRSIKIRCVVKVVKSVWYVWDNHEWGAVQSGWCNWFKGQTVIVRSPVRIPAEATIYGWTHTMRFVSVSSHVIHRNKHCWHRYVPGETSMPLSQHSNHFIMNGGIALIWNILVVGSPRTMWAVSRHGQTASNHRNLEFPICFVYNGSSDR